MIYDLTLPAYTLAHTACLILFPAEQPKTSLPIDILGLQANKDVAIMFGLGLFNDIHTRMAQCRDERNKIEAKYTNQSKRMHQYYNETERVIFCIDESVTLLP